METTSLHLAGVRISCPWPRKEIQPLWGLLEHLKGNWRNQYRLYVLCVCLCAYWVKSTVISPYIGRECLALSDNVSLSAGNPLRGQALKIICGITSVSLSSVANLATFYKFYNPLSDTFFLKCPRRQSNFFFFFLADLTSSPLTTFPDIFLNICALILAHRCCFFCFFPVSSVNQSSSQTRTRQKCEWLMNVWR